jgi:hypothetical protein
MEIFDPISDIFFGLVIALKCSKLMNQVESCLSSEGKDQKVRFGLLALS